MVRKIKFVRVDKEAYERLKQISLNLQQDIYTATGKKVKKIAYGDVIKFAVLPRYNENFIQLDLREILKDGRKF